MWQPSARYPDPAVEVLDSALRPLPARQRRGRAARDRLPLVRGTGVVRRRARCLLWSDIPNDRILRWDEETGAVSVFRKPSDNANGNTRDQQGRLVTCEHGARRVTRTEHDGSITVLAERFEGRRLNSPNDVVVKSDGSVWFTDPAVRHPRRLRGHPGRAGAAAARLPHRRATRVRSTRRGRRPRADRTACASRPTRRQLYLVESRATPNRLILVYDVVGGTGLANGRTLIDAGPGTPDGFRCDVDGNLWCGWGMGSDELDGVLVFNPDGEAIGRIRLPERCANLCFGGRARNRLFMAASQSVYALYVETQGCPGG